MKKKFGGAYKNISADSTGSGMPSSVSGPAYLYSKKFLGIYDLMKISWKTLKERFSKITLIFIVAVMLFFVAFTFLIAVASVWKNWVATFAVGFLILIMVLFFSVIQNAAFFEVMNDENIRIRDAFKKSLSKFSVCLKCLFGCLLVCANFLFLFAVLWTILALSHGIFSGGQQKEFVSALSIINWLGEAFILFFFTPFFVWFCVLQIFSFLAAVWNNMSAGKSVAYAYGLIRRNSKGILWRTLVFSILCFIALVIFAKFAGDFFSIVLMATVSFILDLWMLIFVCTMYDNLCRIEGAEVGKQDLRSVKIFMKTGAVLLVPAFALLVFTGNYTHQISSSMEIKNGGETWTDIERQMDADRTTDTDGDGLLDSEEKELGTNPNKKDSDGDGLSDYDEVRVYNTNPNKVDTDSDGLFDYEETIKLKTDALKADTDGDGYTDGDEVKNGYDPLGAGKIKQQYIPSTNPESGSEENTSSEEQTLKFE